MAEFHSVEEARRLPGLRLVLTTGVPGPWGESAKGIFHAKKLPFARVRQRAGDPNDELHAWTGHRNAPVAIFEDERPRAGWAEILLLAERLAPAPRLVPEDPGERALLFGLAHELCGEQGFGWSRRLMLLHPALRAAPAEPPPALAIAVEMGRRYGYSPEAGEAAPARCAEILRLFSERLREQRRRGSSYLLGDALSALDIYWAAFAALLQPLPEEHCRMHPAMRQTYTVRDPLLLEAADPILFEHRDFVYRQYLELPVST